MLFKSNPHATAKTYQISFLLPFALCLLTLSTCEEIIIPLTYALDPVTQNKYPIKLSFSISETKTPFSTTTLSLFNYNISLETQSNNETKQVIIGLKYPSTFLTAVEKTFNVEPRQIEFGMEEYTQLIINGNNFVESRDQFSNGGLYTMKAVYNFGDPLQKSNQNCYLVDDQDVYLDELLVLQLLNTMSKRNNIKFTQNINTKTMELEGSLQNFPKISFLNGKSIFQLQIKTNSINYIPRSNSSQSINIIGYKAFKKFSKFQIDEGVINFKRTSQLYQLYLFLGYFFVFTLAFILLSKSKMEESMKFVRSVIDWAVFHNREARVRVLRTELQ